MKTMAELATDNEKQPKQKQNLYYDRKARDRKLEEFGALVWHFSVW
jgi:hypothetical protein